MTYRIKVIAVMLLLTSCTRKRESEIVMDKDGNFYELTVPAQLIWPTEAYRLTPIDTNKYIPKQFKSCSIESK